MKKFSEKPAGVLALSDLKTRKGRFLYYVMFALLCCVCIVAIIPTLWVILTSLKDVQEIYKSPAFFPKEFTWDRIKERVSQDWLLLDLGRSMINTVILSVGNVVMTIVVGGFGGYVISKMRPKGYKLVMALVLWTIMMPGQLRTVPVYISYLNFPFASSNSNGIGISILDTYWPMWLGAAANAFNVMLFKNSFDSLPTSYVEAAKLDGCGNFQIFFRIMFPLSMPVIVYVAIGAINGSWSEFFVPYLVLQNDKLFVTPLKIYLMKSDPEIKMNTYLMGLIFASIPPYILFAIFQKQIMGGINVGGVKG